MFMGLGEVATLRDNFYFWKGVRRARCIVSVLPCVDCLFSGGHVPTIQMYGKRPSSTLSKKWCCDHKIFSVEMILCKQNKRNINASAAVTAMICVCLVIGVSHPWTNIQYKCALLIARHRWWWFSFQYFTVRWLIYFYEIVALTGIQARSISKFE